MKKAACAVLMLTMVVFLINPWPSEARGGHGGGNGHWGSDARGGGWWPWWPRAVIGGAAVLSPYYYSPQLSHTFK
jgi:hypothetical protein